MKKLVLIFLLTAVFLGTVTGCKKEESAPVSYEYVTRELPKAKFLDAAKKFAGGNGTKESPYLISSAAELSLFEKKVNDDSDTTYAKAYYKLTKDIILNDTSDFNKWAESGTEYSWNPVGNVSGFEGSFDGNGHKISGLYINLNSESATASYGLFAKLKGKVINLIIDKSYIAVSGATTQVGFIAGELSGNSTIENCEVNGVIDCYDGKYGGIAGNSISISENFDKTPVIKNCTFAGKINQVKEESFNNLGGVLAAGDGVISKCTNKGEIVFDGYSADSVGGILGYMGLTKITECTNEGTLECTKMEDTAGVTAGGIVGKVFTMNSKNGAKTKVIENCVNNGKVSAQMYAGGIVGTLANDYTNCCVCVSKCTNNGEVASIQYTGGIIGHLASSDKNSNSENVIIKDCVNTADLMHGTVGGIIASIMLESGDITVENCKNSGNLSTTEQNAAGIIAYWLMQSEIDTKVKILSCENIGKIESSLNAGGILCYADNPVGKTVSDATEIIVKKCSNSGEITTQSVNGYIGGVAGCIGMKNVFTTFDSCTNTGKIYLNNKKADSETLASAEETALKLSRVCGGIIGKVGKGLYLDTNNDVASVENINKENAFVTIKNCKSTGEFAVNDKTEYKTKDGELIYENFFGGIIGNASGEKEYSVNVINSIYTNFERGLGNKDLPDVGKKTN